MISWLLIFMETVTPSFIMEYDVRPNRLFVEYLIYSPYTFDANGPWYEKVPQSALDVLLNPKDPKIPSNFELLYRSNVDDPRNTLQLEELSCRTLV